jgi:hypothetical protein
LAKKAGDIKFAVTNQAEIARRCFDSEDISSQELLLVKHLNLNLLRYLLDSSRSLGVDPAGDI